MSDNLYQHRISGFNQPDFSFIFKDFNYGKHIEVLGGIGTGKTNFIIWFLSKTDKRVIVFNPLGLVEYNLFCQIVLTEKDIIKAGSIQKYIDAGYEKISITFTEEFLGNDLDLLRRFFDDYIAKAIFMYEDKLYTQYQEHKGLKKNVDFKRRAHLILLIDELLYVCDGEKMLPYHRNILFSGRNHGISHIGLTQRNQHISKLITTQSYMKIIFRLDQYDINALKDKIKGVDVVDNLKDYHFMVTKGNHNPEFFTPIPNMMHSDTMIKRYKEGIKNE